MQFKLAAFASLVVIVAAQDIASIVAMLPSCSLTCLSNAITSSGCALTDYSCQCGAKKNDITKVATPCIVKSCSINDSLSVQSVSGKICAAVASGSSSGSSSAASGASSASHDSSSVSPSAGSAASSVSSEASSAIASVTSAVGSAATSVGGAATTAGTGGAGKVQVGGAVYGAAALIAMVI